MVRINISFKTGRKYLPFLFIFVLIHFLKDITQDILKIATPLDFFGDVKEDLSIFPLFIQYLFVFLGFTSFIAEAFLLIAIPVVIRKKKITTLERIIWVVVIFLIFYFLIVTFLDPRFNNFLK